MVHVAACAAQRYLRSAAPVLRALLGRNPRQVPAQVEGFVRVRVKGQPYPACIPQESGGVVDGLLLTDISSDELLIFDEFEDTCYDRREVPVQTEGSSSQTEAHMYVWADPTDLLLEEPWDYDAFVAEHLDAYTAMCVEFREEVRRDMGR